MVRSWSSCFSEISAYNNRAENYLSSWRNVLVEKCFYFTSVQFLPPRIHSSTLPCRNENGWRIQPMISYFPVPPFLNQQIFDTFRDVICERGPLLIRTISCRFCHFYGTFLSVDLCFFLLKMSYHAFIPRDKLKWSFAYHLKYHWINDIQQSSVRTE